MQAVISIMVLIGSSLLAQDRAFLPLLATALEISFRRFAAMANNGQRPADFIKEVLEATGDERNDAKQLVYLITISRVLPSTLDATDLRDIKDMSREEVVACMRDACSSNGREAGIIQKLVVFKENHASGEVHFHIAIKFYGRGQRFGPLKAALRQRHRLASHWSCTHTQWWSAVRYGVIPSPRKQEVDATPAVFRNEVAT